MDFGVGEVHFGRTATHFVNSFIPWWFFVWTKTWLVYCFMWVSSTFVFHVNLLLFYSKNLFFIFFIFLCLGTYVLCFSVGGPGPGGAAAPSGKIPTFFHGGCMRYFKTSLKNENVHKMGRHASKMDFSYTKTHSFSRLSSWWCPFWSKPLFVKSWFFHMFTYLLFVFLFGPLD